MDYKRGGRLVLEGLNFRPDIFPALQSLQFFSHGGYGTRRGCLGRLHGIDVVADARVVGRELELRRTVATTPFAG